MSILVKGAGEKASAVAHRLHQYGLRKIVMTELPMPRAERRGVSFCEALIAGQKYVCGVASQRAAPSMASINRLWSEGKIPIIADPETKILHLIKVDILIDGIMAKRNTGTKIADAPLVIALGPGFVAGKDAHFVIETNPASPHLGRIISKGQAEEDTGIPTSVLGLTTERLIRSPAEGCFGSLKEIGDKVREGEMLGVVNSRAVKAPISGCIWGLIIGGLKVKRGQKIGDMDPSGERKRCFEITAQAQAIAEGVMNARRTFHAK
jgi:xanthine dehydrogenase accessory factor